MSAVLALGAEPRPVAWMPLPTVPRTQGERFALELERQLVTGNFAAEERNLGRAYEEAAVALREAGVAVANPYAAFAGGTFGQLRGLLTLSPAERDRIAALERAWDAAVGRLRAERPQESERYLYSHEVAALARRRAETAAREAMAAEGLGGGLRALIAGVERALGRGVVPAAEVADAQAAVAAARGEQIVADANPAGPEAAAAHQHAVAAALAKIETPEAPPLPELPRPVVPPPEALHLARLSQAELRAHVRSVVDELLAARAGNRADAAWRPDLGAITIEWGDDSAGLAHILARRRAEGLDAEQWVRDMLPLLLVHGRPVEVQYRPSARVVLEFADARAVLRLDRDGQRENWVLTAFRRRGGESGGGEPGELPSTPAYAPPRRDIGAAEGASPTASIIAPAARRFNAYTPTGRAVLVEPRVVELDRLIASHGPDGRPNPAYPHAEGLQPRDRSAAPSQDQVRTIAARLIPERLLPNVEARTGAPIIGPDLVVESATAAWRRCCATSATPTWPRSAKPISTRRSGLGSPSRGCASRCWCRSASPR